MQKSTQVSVEEPVSPRKRFSLQILKKNTPHSKKKLEDYEVQELRKKKLANFSQEFLKSVKFVKDKKTKRAYSMKTIFKTDFAEDEQTRFLSKLREIRRLKHPNLINLHHYFEDESKIYLILDDICGGNFKILFDSQKKRYYEREAFLVVYQLCLVVEFLHRNQIFHGKISLQNLYFKSEEVLKLNYFWMDSLEEVQNYEDFSPEMIKRNAPHPATDIWNIALVLYELVHGIHPFRGVSNYQTCQKIMKEEKIPFGNYLSDEIVELFQGLLQKKKEYRWYFNEIFICDWFIKYQTYYGFDIKVDLKEFNASKKKSSFDEGEDMDSDESVQFKKKVRRNSDVPENSAYLNIQRNKTLCIIYEP